MTMLSRKTSKTPLFLFVLLTLGMASAVFASDAAHQWLMKMSDAAQDLNYRGHFVYQHDGQMEAMEIVHRASQSGTQERLLSLNGSPREIIRNKEGVWCYLPDEKSIVISHRKQTEKNFPALIPMSLKQLDPYYRFKLGREERMSGRMAQKVMIEPKDKYRYGYRLWADKSSGLLLKADLVDGKGKVLEQFMFTDVDIGRKINLSELQVTVDQSGLVLHKQDKQNGSQADKSKWMFKGLPSGFAVVRYQTRMNPMKHHSMTHIVLSDGLAAVSVFIESAGKDAAEGRNSMGAVNAWRGKRHGYRVTVVGEVPAATVKKIVHAVYPENQLD